MASVGNCQKCFCILRWMPVIFIVAVISWSYYAYIIQMLIFTSNNIVEQILLGIFYHIFFFFFVWSYWQAIFVSPGNPPLEFNLSHSDVTRLKNETNEDNKIDILKEISKDLPVYCRTFSGSVRYCEYCLSIKPDRAHHCSTCNQCVLKMDHHCPWINNCVGFKNYKFFYLFLFYGLLYCLYVASTSAKFFVMFWTGGLDNSSNGGKFHVLFLFFAAVMFALSLISLFGFHSYLICKNMSTLESFHSPSFQSGPQKNAYNINTKSNLREIMGPRICIAFCPIFTTIGDGVNFPMRVGIANIGVASYNTIEPELGLNKEFNDSRHKLNSYQTEEE